MQTKNNFPMELYRAVLETKRQKYEMEQTPEDIKLINSDSKIFITQAGFWGQDNFKKPFDLATLIMISTFNQPDEGMETPLRANHISLNMIWGRFNFKSNAKRKMKNVKESVQTLVDNEVIKVLDAQANEITNIIDLNENEIISIEQAFVEENKQQVKRFYHIKWVEFDRIMQSTQHSDNAKVNTLAVFGSLVSSMNNNVSTENASIEWGLIASLYQSFNYRTDANIGKRVGIGTKTASSYINDLVDMKLIQFEKVRRDGANEYSWNKYYSRYETYPQLLEMLYALLDSPLPTDSKEFKDYSYINIYDIWMEGYSVYRKDEKSSEFIAFMLTENENGELTEKRCEWINHNDHSKGKKFTFNRGLYANAYVRFDNELKVDRKASPKGNGQLLIGKVIDGKVYEEIIENRVKQVEQEIKKALQPEEVENDVDDMFDDVENETVEDPKEIDPRETVDEQPQGMIINGVPTNSIIDDFDLDSICEDD